MPTPVSFGSYFKVEQRDIVSFAFRHNLQKKNMNQLPNYINTFNDGFKRVVEENGGQVITPLAFAFDSNTLVSSPRAFLPDNATSTIEERVLQFLLNYVNLDNIVYDKTLAAIEMGRNDAQQPISEFVKGLVFQNKRDEEDRGFQTWDEFAQEAYNETGMKMSTKRRTELSQAFQSAYLSVNGLNNVYLSVNA